MSEKLQSEEEAVVGVVADTHGILLPAALKVLKSVDLIVHAGDVGNTEVMANLKSMAPVFAVRGNMDMIEGLRGLPETEVVEVGDALLYVIHDINRLDIVPSKAGFDAVIFGHLHYPSISEQSGVLFLNPGSAAQPRRNYPPSLALLHIRGNSVKAQIVSIDDGS